MRPRYQVVIPKRKLILLSNLSHIKTYIAYRKASSEILNRFLLLLTQIWATFTYKYIHTYPHTYVPLPHKSPPVFCFTLSCLLDKSWVIFKLIFLCLSPPLCFSLYNFAAFSVPTLSISLFNIDLQLCF